MKTLVKSGPADAEKAAALVLLCSSHPVSRETVIVNLPPSSRYTDKVLALVRRGDFLGKFQETFWLYPEDMPAQRILLVGMHLPEEEKQHLGEGPHLQHVIAAAVSASRKLCVTELCLPCTHLLVQRFKPRIMAQLMVEAALLANYQFTKYTSKTENRLPAVASLTLLCDQPEVRKEAEEGARLGSIAGEWTCYARDLQNMPPNELTPEIFASLASAQAKAAGLGHQVLDEKEMQVLGMGALLGVAKAVHSRRAL
jgi:leucyl aminopeptidase